MTKINLDEEVKLNYARLRGNWVYTTKRILIKAILPDLKVLAFDSDMIGKDGFIKELEKLANTK